MEERLDLWVFYYKVLQDSILSLILFNIYKKPTREVIYMSEIRYYQYAVMHLHSGPVGRCNGGCHLNEEKQGQTQSKQVAVDSEAE